MTTVPLHPVLASLIEITRQRDQHALELSLVKALHALLGSGAVQLYRPRTVDGREALLLVDAVGDAAALPAAAEPLLLRGLREREPVLAAGGGTGVLVHPLLGMKREVVALIVVAAAGEPSQLQHRLDPVLQIYQNFLGVLHDYQRDTLTGLLNRRTFDGRILKMLAAMQSHGGRAGESQPPAHCLAILDIDHFKRINDRFGHLYGDEVLLLFAALMERSFREDDLLFRFGGEEFVAILTDLPRAQAEAVLNRFRETVAAHAFPQVGQVTVSIGMTQIRPQDLPAHIIDRADAALYYAKQHGRNRVCDYDALVASGELRAQAPPSGDIDLF